MESKDAWTPEIEKKYKISNKYEMEDVRGAAERALLVKMSRVLQRDWVPDFEDSGMKKAGVLLRIRNETYLEGNGPEWTVTLKQKKKDKSIHFNQEMEASSEEPDRISVLEEEIDRLFHKKMDLKRIAALDYDYANSVGLTRHRMLLEKYRETFRDALHTIVVALDELPEPLGCFVEVETTDASVFPEWEARLKLQDASAVRQDYGELVKELGDDKRVLTFDS